MTDPTRLQHELDKLTDEELMEELDRQLLPPIPPPDEDEDEDDDWWEDLLIDPYEEV